MYTDTLTLAGLTVKNQAIETASKLSDSFLSDSADGLLGLAWPSLNTVKPSAVATPMQNLMQQGVVAKDRQLFTAYLTNSNDDVAPCYTFGYIDDKLLDGQTIHWTQVDNAQGFWQISSTSTQINGTRVESANGTAVMDTGTTLALLDDKTCAAIYAAIPGAVQDKNIGGWVFPASSVDHLPSVWIDIGGQMCLLHNEDLSFCPVGDGKVYGGIQSRGSLPFNLYGDTVLKAMYAIFNQGAQTFG